jgi:hypothetical protein
MSESHVTTHGPIFDGRAAREVDHFLKASQQEIGETGAQMVQAQLDRVLQNPTGYYRSRVTYRDPRVTDSGVVYGPWLEGVSSRNQTSRFRGYATFRRVTQALQHEAEHTAQRVLPPYLRRMN